VGSWKFVPGRVELVFSGEEVEPDGVESVL